MARHNRTHAGSESHAEGASAWGSRQLHKDWRTWVVVGLMLTAMIMYVLTLDDSILPVFMRS
jgi:hypothetical protein